MHRTTPTIHNRWRRFPRIAILARVSLLAATMLIGSGAWGQTSGSVALVSNYMYRGISLSDNNPVAQAGVAYDSPAGWFAGAFSSRIVIPGNSSHIQLIGYAGYAQQCSNGVSWETGATDTVYLQDASNNYGELFAGLASEHFSGRVYYSPDYLGQGRPSLYAELNASYSPREHVHLLAHLGHLHVPQVGDAEVASRFDGSIGLNVTLGRWNTQFTLIATERTGATYLPHYAEEISEPHTRTGVVTVSYSF